MKTISTIIVLLFTAISLNAQSPAYQKAMGQALGQMAQAENAEDLQNAANTFDRISAQAPDQYLPKYYAALSMIHQSFYMNGASLAEKDAVLDAAMERVVAAQELSPNNVELEVMNGYVLMAKMSSDPATRGQSYSPKIYGSFGKAMQMDPNNPRASMMMARMELGTSQFFGSEPTKACGLAQQSIVLFDASNPEGFNPSWGKEQAVEILQACN